MKHKLGIISSNVDKKKRTQVIVGQRVVNDFLNTTIADRDLTIHVKTIRTPQAEDLTFKELTDTVASMYGLKEFPCPIVHLDSMPVIPSAIRTGYCHCGGEKETAKPGNPANAQIVSSTSVGLDIQSAKGSKAEIKGNMLEIVNDVIVTLVQPVNEERTFTDKESMLKEAGIRDVTPLVTMADVVSKKQ